jgi:hypothetical protein
LIKLDVGKLVVKLETDPGVKGVKGAEDGRINET